MVQVRLHVLKQLQDPVLQNIKETFQGVKLPIHQLEHSTQGDRTEKKILFKPLCHFLKQEWDFDLRENHIHTFASSVIALISLF